MILWCTCDLLFSIRYYDRLDNPLRSKTGLCDIKHWLVQVQPIEMESLMKTKIKVVHIINYLGVGGLEIGVIKYSRFLAKQGFDITIICFSWDETILPSIPDNIKIIKLEREAGFDWRIIFRLASIFKERQYDILHSHNWTTFVYSVLAAKLARVPVVLHGEHGREGGKLIFDKKRLALNRLLLPACDNLTTVSKDITYDWQKKNILYPWQIITIENGVDLERFRPEYNRDECRRKIGLPENAFIIGTVVGYIRPVKDLKTLILAFNRLLESGKKLHLVIVGFGEQVKLLQKLIASLAIEKHATFLGVRDDIPQVLTAYDVFVNSSLYEGMSNTILEAMAMSKPVVATDVGGTPFIIKDNWSGIIVPSSSPEKMAAAIGKLIDDSDLRNRLGRNGRRSIEIHHNLKHTINSYAHLYTSSYSNSLKKSKGLRSITRRITYTSIAPFVNIYKKRMKPGLHVLTTHQVVPMERWNSLLQPRHSIPLETFEKQLTFLLENARAIDADEIGERLRRRKGFDEPLFTVTFDDGFKDVYDYAFPLLREHRIPFFIFLVTEALLSGNEIWWCNVVKRVHALFHQNWLGWLNFCDDNSWLFSRNGFSNKLDIITIIKELLNQLNLQNAEFRSNFCIDLERRTENLIMSTDMDLLSREEIKLMLDSGLAAIGSHSSNHLYMDNLEFDELEIEIARSKEVIEDIFGIDVKSFAYPWGRSNTACQNVCKGVGYSMAFTTRAGRNYKDIDPYSLKRRDAGYLAENLMHSKSKALVVMRGLMDFSPR